jgi:hypothetical protein
MTTTPATTRPNTAFGLLFGPAQVAADSLAILSDATDANLDRALRGVPPAARATAVKEVKATAAGLLDINLIDMLIAGWRTYRDLTSAARRTLAQPGSKELVSLVTHRITAEQQPYVRVLVNGQPVVTVQLKFSVDFDVSALLAEITEGQLVAIHTGRCDITATLAVDDIGVATGQTRLELPGAVPVSPGIRLLPAADYPSGPGQPGATPAVPRVQQAQPAVLSPVPVAPPSQSVTPGGEWWEATRAATPAVAAPCGATPPAAATPKNAGSSKRWWER